jgi:menaquinone-specific isochorismate synthase
VILDESGEAEFPLIFLQKLFNKADASEWKDFEDSVFIPEFVFLQDMTGNYIIHNCYSDNYTPASLRDLKYLYSNKGKNPQSKKFLPVLLDALNDRSTWSESINEIKEQITKNIIQKAVLSRHMQYSYTGQPDYTAVAANLEKQTSAYRFAFQRGNSFVAGASPEKLYSLIGNTIYSEAIAGSAKRGRTEEEDMQNAAELMNSCKERFEHDCVVQFIASALSKYSSSVAFSSTPEIKRLLRIMHLRTEIQAEGIRNVNLDNVISDLHPTPATCGEPKETAYSLINRLETHSRGLYCGLSGWLTNKQNGNFYILMRLALLTDMQMHVYAGCGIVKDSDADTEFEESQYKAESIIRLFYNEDQ